METARKEGDQAPPRQDLKAGFEGRLLVFYKVGRPLVVRDGTETNERKM